MKGKANHSVCITFQNNVQSEQVQGALHSIYGRKICTTCSKVGKNRIVFALDNIIPGNYLLKLMIGDQESVVKVPVVR